MTIENLKQAMQVLAPAWEVVAARQQDSETERAQDFIVELRTTITNDDAARIDPAELARRIRVHGIDKLLAEPEHDIGWAVSCMRAGGRVARAGWNGKGMYIAYQAGYPDGIPINENTARATGEPLGAVRRFLPYVGMRTADGSFVPWLCSQTDLLATDWDLVPKAQTWDPVHDARVGHGSKIGVP
jgi:hypothetical protein